MRAVASDVSMTAAVPADGAGGRGRTTALAMTHGGQAAPTAAATMVGVARLDLRAQGGDGAEDCSADRTVECRLRGICRRARSRTGPRGWAGFVSIFRLLGVRLATREPSVGGLWPSMDSLRSGEN